MLKSINFNKQAIYPFLMLLLALLILVVVNGLTTSALSVFDEELIKSFHIKIRTDLRYKEAITNFVSAVFIVFAGTFVDKFKVKSAFLIGLTSLFVAFIIYSQAQSIYNIYLAHFFLGIALITSGSMPSIILVSTWFVKKRGLALGFALMGTSLGGFVFPTFLTKFIAEYGWRDTFLMLSCLPVLLFIIVVLVLKSSPSDLNLKAYGQESNPIISDVSEPILLGISFKKALRTPTFWLISLSGFLSFFAVVGIVSNLFLHLRSFNLSPIQASSYLSLYFGFSLLGKFLISTISDYVDTFTVFTICAFGMTLGAFLFWTMEEPLLKPAVILTAICWGGIYTLYNLAIVRNFGLKSAGKINGMISSFESAGSFLAPVITGWLFGMYNNSYKGALMVITVSLLLTTICSLFFRKNQVN